MLQTNFDISYPRSVLNPDGDPLPTQQRFHNDNSKYRLLAGGFGTGKTTSLCLELIKDCSIPNNYILLGRKDLQELKSTTLKEFLDIVPEQMITFYNKQDRIIRLINGTEIYYTNLDEGREASEKIKSLNLGSAYIDQLEELDEQIFLAIVGRLRRPNTRRNFIATCNPAGHDWVYHRWKSEPQKHYALFESITLENKYLPPDYVEQLLQYPEKWVKRYVYCSWDDYEGIVYNEFTEAFHKVPPYKPFESERHVFAVDYGFRNPTAIIFSATDYDSKTRIYDEFYQSGTRIVDIVDRIKQNHFYRKALILADPSMWNVQRDGFSIADEFAMNGIGLVRADNNVLQGIDKVNSSFKEGKLVVCENCTSWLREQGNYKWKEIKAGQNRNEYEEPVKKNDHLMDATRYLINYLHKPASPVKKKVIKGRRPAFKRKERTLADY